MEKKEYSMKTDYSLTNLKGNLIFFIKKTAFLQINKNVIGLARKSANLTQDFHYEK
jgi:hypothetical protein